VSCENKKIVFRTRDSNYSINIMKLTSCWIEKQEQPLCFQILFFTSSRIKPEEEKSKTILCEIPTIDFTLFNFFLPLKSAFEM